MCIEYLLKHSKMVKSFVKRTQLRKATTIEVSQNTLNLMYRGDSVHTGVIKQIFLSCPCYAMYTMPSRDRKLAKHSYVI